jgi:hypothetical protein
MWSEYPEPLTDRQFDMTVYLDDTALAVLNHTHALAIFRNEDVLLTAQAIARLSNEPIISVDALAEALRYHLGTGPEYRYRPLAQALDDYTPGQIRYARLQQVLAEVEHCAQQP